MSDAFESWSALEAHLKTISSLHLEVWESHTGHAAVRFAYPFRGELLGVFFVHNELPAAGRSWVFVGVRVSPAVSFDLAHLMKQLPRQPVGALSLAADYLCLGHNLPVRGLRHDDLAVVLDQLCALALHVQQLASAAPKDVAVFNYLID